MVVMIGRRLEVLSIEYMYVCMYVWRREVDRIGTFLERFIPTQCEVVVV